MKKTNKSAVLLLVLLVLVAVSAMYVASTYAKYTAEVTGGKATFTNVELPSESTTATINYLGNDYYNPSNTTIDITINEEPTDEPTTEPEQNPTLEPKPVTTKTVTSIKGPVAGNPIAMLLLVMMALVSTISIRRQK